jgi:hypothetical protein
MDHEITSPDSAFIIEECGSKRNESDRKQGRGLPGRKRLANPKKDSILIVISAYKRAFYGEHGN